MSYFVQTMMDYKNGKRKSSDPRKRNAALMVDFAKAMTDAEISAAAEYFGTIPWQPLWVKVKETNTVPKTHIDNGLFIPNEGTETEPVGNRIVEVPENEDLKNRCRRDKQTTLSGRAASRQYRRSPLGGRKTRMRRDGAFFSDNAPPGLLAVSGLGEPEQS